MESKEMTEEILERVLATGEPVTIEEGLLLNETCTTDELRRVADKVRSKWCGNRVHTCSIVNARSGRCGEDCKWCAQSAHYNTGCEEYDHIPHDEMMDAFRTNKSHGIGRFSLVTSGRKTTGSNLEYFCRLYEEARGEGGVELCASMGLMDKESLRKLYESGVTRYHCNLETGSDYFPKLCTTHSQEDKLETIRMAREVGMEVCSGGIIGMGETMRDRLQLAEEAREAGAVSIPINILNPIPGTPLENQPLISEEEVMRSVALMRLVAPRCTLHFAGGRARLSKESMRMIMRGGANGALMGDMLTTVGNKIKEDFEMFAETGYDIS